MEIIGDYEIPDGWTQPLADGGEGADVIVFGTPAYFYSCAGRLKVIFDRMVAIYPDLPNKQYYYLLAQGDENKDTFAGTIKSLDGFLDCYEGSKFKGMVAAPVTQRSARGLMSIFVQTEFWE